MERDFNKKCCENCKKGALLVRCERLKSLPEYASLCSEEIQPASLFNDNFFKKLQIKKNYCCDEFKNYWLEYPIAVKGVECEKIEYNQALFNESGCLVKIKTCREEYGKKTYLGFLLGDLVTNIYQNYNSETNILTISTLNNPAIFVPDLKKIIFGYESWWSKIENEEDLKEITDDDISNVWYVKLLNKM